MTLNPQAFEIQMKLMDIFIVSEADTVNIFGFNSKKL